METMTITKDDVRSVMAQWEQNYRTGLTISHEEVAQKSVEQVAAENADYVWGELKKLCVRVN